MRLLFCGDFVMHNPERFKISEGLSGFIKHHDFGICNLEGSFKTDDDRPILKAGPHVYNCEGSIKILKDIGINVVALANNHIMDFGTESLARTMDKLIRNGFYICGAGQSFDEAYKPLILEKNGEYVSLINVGQAEFGVLKERNGASGYAWINHPQLKKIITEQKEKYENVIVFAHCGLEDVIIPLPEWRELYHEIVDLTDSPFIATHPHIIQGYEEYKNNPICYSLGNFYFEKEMGGQEWNRSLLISIDTETGEYKIRPISLVNGVLDFDETKECSKIIKERNEMIIDGKLEDRANQLAKKMWQEIYSDYYNQLIEGESILKVLKYLIKGIAKKILKRTSKSHRETMLLHNLQIETHRWVTERYLYGKNKAVNRF